MSDNPESPEDGSPRPVFLTWAYGPCLVVFLSSACIMVLELVAGRLIAQYVGNSLYTWTSIIGVILAGLTLGHILGGRLADRNHPAVFLGWLFLAASFVSFLTLPVNEALGLIHGLTSLSWPLRIFVRVFLAFFLPPLLLGMISPGVTKFAIERSSAVGTTIGSIYAWGAGGSIVGTFMTGFWLVEIFGSRTVVLLVALLLAMIGVALGPRRGLHVLWTIILIAVMLLSRPNSSRILETAAILGLRERHKTLFSGDSAYQHVEVFEEPRGERILRVMRTDYLQQGWVDLADLDYLDMNFERVARAVIERCIRTRGKVTAFVIGGGTYTVPRWVARRWPSAAVDVAEIDPLVVEANCRALGLGAIPGIRTLAEDARNALDDLPEDRQYNLIYADAYGAYSMPFHLTTDEFNRNLAQHLNPGGVYVLNVIDNAEYGLLLGAMVATLRRTFPYVYVFTQHREGVKPGLDNYVVAATREPVITIDWRAGHHLAFPGAVLSASEVQALVEKSGGLILTDDHAPVEQLIAPALRHHRW